MDSLWTNKKKNGQREAFESSSDVPTHNVIVWYVLYVTYSIQDSLFMTTITKEYFGRLIEYIKESFWCSPVAHLSYNHHETSDLSIPAVLNSILATPTTLSTRSNSKE